MSKHTPKQPQKQTSQEETAIQLSMLQKIEGLENWEHIRREEINGIMYYSILDIFKFYGDTQNYQREWQQVQKTLEKQGFGSDTDSVQLLMHKFEGQGQRDTPIATREVFFRIAQSTNFKNWEHIRRAMSQALDEKVESAIQKKMRQTIEYYEGVGWGNRPEIFALRAQLEANISLEELKASISKLLTFTAKEWQNFHSIEIQTLLGKTIGQIKEARDPKKSARTNMNPLEANALVHGERDLNYLLSLQGNVDSQRIFDMVQLVFEPIGRNLQSTLDRLGYDALTGLPLLGDGKK